MATFSFHETKNYNCGEGGALLINDPVFAKRAEIIREKGTNRSQFFRGEVDKYSWVDTGSSFLPSEIIAAFLYGQFEHADRINEERLTIWKSYYDRLAPLASDGFFRLPIIPDSCTHNAHLFYLLMNTTEEQEALLSYLRGQGVGAVFHYIPLHTAPMGQKLGYKIGELPISESISSRIVRLPLFCGITSSEIEYIIDQVRSFFEIPIRTAVAANG
jgi:dTDP-4-amino-4,6-dideoxygalactose transaminase